MELLKSFSYFSGKKILYVHGFGSSGASNTVKLLREMLPEADIIAPDLPVKPEEAMDLLHSICESERPSLIIGTSMGGMYAEMLRGYNRILVNPAFEIAETMRTNIGLGKQAFLSPRKDGTQWFMLTKALQAEYREVSAHCFDGKTDDDDALVFGLFGMNDPLVHTCDLFRKHYAQAIRFKGEHRLNDHVLIHSVMPVVQWIARKQESLQPPILYVHLNTLFNIADKRPISEAAFAFERLAQRYDIYIVAPQDSDPLELIEEHLGVPAYNRVIRTNHEHLLYGDYLIDARKNDETENFLGTLLQFGSDEFRSWEYLLDYFEKLGGQ